MTLSTALSRPFWTTSVPGRPRGLLLAREKQTVLVWDDHHWLTLYNHRGERQGQVRWPGGLVAGCAADDGSAYAALGPGAGVAWLAPDLSMRWPHALKQPAVAGCLDPHGQYLAVSDARGGVTVLDRNGRLVWRAVTPRPLHHLAFVPEQPMLLGCADVGLVVAFDFQGQVAWRDGLASHVGDLATTGAGDRIVLACFSEGLRLYGPRGQKLGQHLLPEPVRLAALSYDGQRTLAAGLTRRLVLLDGDGRLLDEALAETGVEALALGPLADRASLALADSRVLMVAIG